MTGRDRISIGTPIGDMDWDRDWLSHKILNSSNVVLIGDTYFIKDNYPPPYQMSWSINKSDWDDTIIYIRDKRIDDILE